MQHEIDNTIMLLNKYGRLKAWTFSRLDDHQEVWPGATRTFAAASNVLVVYGNRNTLSCYDTIKIKQHPTAWVQ